MRGAFYSILAGTLLFATSAWGQPRLEFSGYVNLDLATNPDDGRIYQLDKTHIDIDAGFESLGAKAHLSVLNASGDLPNLSFGTLQGFDNIEVADRRFRVYEAWLEQDLFGGQGSVRIGLYDLNSEFYATESSALFIAPAYGIGSELAATGSGGPSIYPSTALAARFRFKPTENSYVQLAALNAKAGSIGERGGVDTDFDEGVISIAELGWSGRGLVAAGAWSYSKRSPDLFDVRPDGQAQLRRSAGAYLLFEQPLHTLARGGEVTGFLRAGLSDGDTGPFEASWQAGIVIAGLMPSRPEGVIGVGVSGGALGPKFRAASAAAGAPLSSSERQLEVTYSDRLGERLTIQPNLQIVADPGGDPAKDALYLFTLRLTAEF